MDNHFWTTSSDFFEHADKLKAEFDQAFAKPLETTPERFCWDYWYVKNQYKLLRTPADHFFSEELFQNLQQRLTKWGRQHLGCSSLSPMWLSYYIDGCEQKAHTDSPHGPWAFVYSITDWDNRGFNGGETFLYKPETLCYWDFFDLNKGAETNELTTFIEPHFNQLTVFDPRFPHGVERVEGAHEPSKARIVLHGWFTEPSPQFIGLDQQEVAIENLNVELEAINKQLATIARFHGLLSLGFTISPEGKVLSHKTLCNTLIEMNSPQSDQATIDFLVNSFKKLQFSSNKTQYELVIPFVFK